MKSIVVRRVSCSKTLDSIRVEAVARGWDQGRGWARGLSVSPSLCLFAFVLSPFFNRYLSTNITYYKSPFFEMIDIEIFMPYRSEFDRYLILTSSLVGKNNSSSLNGRKRKQKRYRWEAYPLLRTTYQIGGSEECC